jgi:hypothetical protein
LSHHVIGAEALVSAPLLCVCLPLFSQPWTVLEQGDDGLSSAAGRRAGRSRRRSRQEVRAMSSGKTRNLPQGNWIDAEARRGCCCLRYFNALLVAHQQYHLCCTCVPHLCRTLMPESRPSGPMKWNPAARDSRVGMRPPRARSTHASLPCRSRYSRRVRPCLVFDSTPVQQPAGPSMGWRCR